MVEQKIKFFKFQGKWIKQVPIGDDDSYCEGCIGDGNVDLCTQLPDCFLIGKDAVKFKTLSTEEHQLFERH